MTKYHINKDGDPSVCRAFIRKCPIGGDHFESQEAAFKFIEEKEKKQAEYFASLKQIADLPGVPLTDSELAILPDKRYKRCFDGKSWIPCKEDNCSHESTSNTLELKLVNVYYKKYLDSKANLTNLTVERLQDWRNAPKNEQRRAVSIYISNLTYEKQKKERQKKLDEKLKKAQSKVSLEVDDRNKATENRALRDNRIERLAHDYRYGANAVDNAGRLPGVTYGRFRANGVDQYVASNELRAARVRDSWNMSLHPQGPKLNVTCPNCMADTSLRPGQAQSHVKGMPIYMCRICRHWVYIPVSFTSN